MRTTSFSEMSLHLLLLSSICMKVWAAGNQNISGPNVEMLTFSATLDPAEMYRIQWDFDATYITFEVSVETLGYVGLGFSPNGGMPGSDIMIAWVDDSTGEAQITDRYALFQAEPEIDVVQDYKLILGYQNETHTVIRFRRPLNLCDSEDKSIKRETIRLIWAYHADDPDVNGHAQYHGINRGVKSIFLLNPFKEAPPIPSETVTHDLFNGQIEVPARRTYYNCRSFLPPKFDRKHHLIEMRPVIQKGMEAHVHHIIVYGCVSPVSNSSIDVQHECGTRDMPLDWWTCNAMYLGWAIGGGAYVFPEHVGIPFGTEDDPTLFLMQTHYDNPQLISGLVDSSGIRMIFTPELRKYDGGVLMTGTLSTPSIIIPPHEPAFQIITYCRPECYAEAMEGNAQELKIFGTLLHSHLLGRAIRVRHFREGTELDPISEDMNYDFNLQETRLLAKEVTFKPGDFSVTECFYNSMNRQNLTLGGLSTTQEMCLSFLLYYPKLPMSVCLSVARPSFLARYAGVTVTDDWTIRAPESLAYQKLVPLLDKLVDWNNETIRQGLQALLKMPEPDSYISVCQHGTIRYPSHRAFYTPPSLALAPHLRRGDQCLRISVGCRLFPVTALIIFLATLLCVMHFYLK